jgi:GNAT superfamily N-acetyltransferase
MNEVTVRAITSQDGPAVLQLIQGLADFERLQGPDATEGVRVAADIGRRFDGFLAEVDGQPAGCALYYDTYSTFEGLPKLYLEDIFVLEEHRGTGAGFALFRACAVEAVRRGCDSLEWAVLDWNRRAMDFYERLGGRHQKEWLLYKLEREGLERLASGESDNAT